MTTDEALRAVLTAIRPHVDTDDECTLQRSVDEAFVEIKKTFDEEPYALAAFEAAVIAIAIEARRGYVPEH